MACRLPVMLVDSAWNWQVQRGSRALISILNVCADTPGRMACGDGIFLVKMVPMRLWPLADDRVFAEQKRIFKILP